MISKRHLPCSFKDIKKAANLPSANNSQTTPGIVGADRFPRCLFFIFSGVRRGDLSTHSRNLPLQPIFFCLLPKNQYWRRQIEVSSPGPVSNGDAANIKRFDRGKLIYWEQEASGRESILPTKEVIQIITRLPLTTLKIIWVQKLNTKLREQGKIPFTTIVFQSQRFKAQTGYWENQPFSRPGIFGAFLLDQRVVTKRYGKQILDGLQQVLPFTTLKSDLLRT